MVTSHFRRTIGLTIARAVGIVLQAAFFILAARLYPPSRLAAPLAAISVAIVVGGATDLGISVRAGRDRQMRTLSDADYRLMLGVRTLLAVTIGLVWAAVAAAGLGRVYTITAPFVVLEALSISTSNLLIINGQPARVAATLVAERVAALVSLVALSSHADGVIGALTVGSVFGAASGWVLLGAPVPMLASVRRSIRTVTESWAFGLAALVAQVQNVDVPIVVWIAGATQGTAYALPSKFTIPLLFLASTEGANVLSSAARLRTEQDRPTRQEISQLLHRATPAVGLTIAGALALSIGAGLFTRIAFGHGYSAATGPLRILALTGAVAAVTTVVMSLLQGLGREVFVARSFLWAVVVGLVATALAAAWWGATGAAWAQLLLQVLLLIPILWGLQRELQRARAVAPAGSGHTPDPTGSPRPPSP